MGYCSKLSLSSIQSRLTTFKKLDLKFKLFIGLLICTIIVIVIYKHGIEKKVNSTNKAFEVQAPPQANWTGGIGQLSQKEIIILQWTTYWGTTYSTDVLDSDKCSILKTGTIHQPPTSRIFDIPCKITYEKRYLNESHALVFHSRNLNYSRSPDDYLLESRRAKNQIWVWHQGESPSRHFAPKDLKAYQNLFNWTMSYRRNSDVYYPYGYVFPRNISKRTGQDNPPNLKMKTSLAAWIVSHCTTSSKREYFVKELQKYIQIDIFGKCGQNKCRQTRQPFYPCYDYIQSKYKFYLSFENSLCVDYITEKFYLALETNMVPVVYGGGLYDQMDYLAVAPENSFIDARKFKSPKDLANYLIYLDGNDDEYLKYFEWKAKYQVVNAYDGYWKVVLGWCNLCQRVYDQIHKRDQHSWNKWYSELYTWWDYAGVLNATAQFRPHASQSKSPVNPSGQDLQYNLDKLQPSCVRPNANFTSYEEYYKVA